jgi:hypothetical protein
VEVMHQNWCMSRGGAGARAEAAHGSDALVLVHEVARGSDAPVLVHEQRQRVK